MARRVVLTVAARFLALAARILSAGCEAEGWLDVATTGCRQLEARRFSTNYQHACASIPTLHFSWRKNFIPVVRPASTLKLPTFPCASR
jgi:hypothetical protein